MLEIASVVFKKFWRKKIWLVSFVSSVFFLVFAIFLWSISLWEEKRMFVDSFFFLVEIFLFIFVVYLGFDFGNSEKKNNIMDFIFVNYPYLSKIYLWNFFGLLGVLLFLVTCWFFVYSLVLFSFFWIDWYFFIISALSWLGIVIKVSILLAFVLFLSSFLSTWLTLLTSIVFYLVSHSTTFLVFQLKKWENFLLNFVFDFFYQVFPHFDKLSLKDHIFLLEKDFLSLSFFNLFAFHFLYLFLLLFLWIIVYSKCGFYRK